MARANSTRRRFFALLLSSLASEGLAPKNLALSGAVFSATKAWVAPRRPGFLHGVCGETSRGGPSICARSSVDA